MIEWLLPSVLSNALIATLIGLVAFCGSRLYRRPTVWHVVWVLALLKLFIPPLWSVSSPISSPPTQVASSSLQTQNPSLVRQGSLNVDRGLSTDGEGIVDTANKEVEIPQAMQWSLPEFNLSKALVSFWAIGSLVLLLLTTYRILRFHFLLSRFRDSDAATNELVKATAKHLRPDSSAPSVRLVDCTVPPLLWPVGRTPSIVLPAQWWMSTTPTQRETVIMHEMVHWRRGDHWVRLLQWIASIVFWWHPLVWLARRELHDIEEQCCDAEVMHRLPALGRAYASALFSASQWLDDASSNSPRPPISTLAMPMSHSNRFETFHRRIQMLPTLKYRPLRFRGLTAMLLLTFLPLSIGILAQAQNPDEVGKASDASQSQTTTLTGTITDTEGNPIADAKVRVVIPAAGLRQFEMTSEYREVWGQTDSLGQYIIDVPETTKEVKASVDILHPGHRRLVGTFMMGGDSNEVTLSPGKKVTFDANLPNSRYYAGQVVDEAGKPIEGVMVFSNHKSDQSHGGVERSRTDAEGRFAIYSYEDYLFSEEFAVALGRKSHTASVNFYHGEYMDANLDRLEVLDLDKRDKLRVVMRSGYKIAGIVRDADGAPVSHVNVSIVHKDPDQRKTLNTNAAGQFQFEGIRGGEATLRVVDVPGNRKSIQKLTFDKSMTELAISLQSFKSPIEKTYTLMGMTVANVTQSIDEAYDLQTAGTKVKGVLIVQPGDRFDSFGIGELRAGDVFWMVGNERVTDLLAMVRQLVKEAKSPTIGPGGAGNTSAIPGTDGTIKVRVVYTYNDDRGHATNTQYMKITPADIAELEKLLAELESKNGE